MKNLLLIEDNPDVRENTAEILELSGYSVATAENGKEGVRMARENPPDLILCDIMMPELDGYGVLHILNKDPKTSKIPFIFLTAKADKSDFRKGMGLGADDYLTKPFDETELLNTIELRLQKSQNLQKFDASWIESEDASGLPEALESIAKNKKIRKYDKKEHIIRQGDHATALFYVISGKVRLSRSDDYGKELITNVVGPGGFFAHTAIFADEVLNEDAVALEDSEIALIPKEDFLALLKNNRQAANLLFKQLSGNILQQEERLLRLAYGNVRERLADALLYLFEKQKGQANAETLDISRDDLAAVAGTATESLIRTLSEFKKEGLVATDGRSIKLKDVQGLKKVALWR